MRQLTLRGLAASLALPALMLLSAGTVQAQHDHMAMDGMDMPIKIPAGAIYTEADVRFMQGMIAHHAQAIYMSHMAASHGANARLMKLATKIDQSQVAEIKLMQDWLRTHEQMVPDTSSWHHMMMAGMLTTEQISALEGSKGTEFDRNYLQYMIQHHEGALKMVDDLLATPRSGQEVNISVFANDVVVVQTAEIGAMRRMLSSL